MKKYLLVLVMALISVFVINAQEDFTPSAGSFSVEVGFTPFAAEGSIGLPDGSITGIYSLTDDLSLRLGLGFTTVSTSSDSKDENWTKQKGSVSKFSISPGIVYSFARTGRLVPYVGAQLDFGVVSDRVEQERKYGSDITKIVVKNGGEDGAYSAFGIGVFTGFNYYFAKNLYVGVEAGLGYESAFVKNRSTETTTNGTVVTIDDKAERKGSAFAIYAVPAIRLGWTF